MPVSAHITKLAVVEALALLGASWFTTSTLANYPWMHRNRVPPPAAPAPPAPAPPPVVPTSPPGVEAVKRVSTAIPGDYAGLGVAHVGGDRPTPLPCGQRPVAPIYSVVRGWSGGAWNNPSGVLLIISVYGAGLGADAMQSAVDGDCGVRGSVNELRANGEAVGGGWRAKRVGDVVVSVQANQADGVTLIEQVTTLVTQQVTGVCVDVNAPGGQAPRNPYWTGGAYAGWVIPKKVTSSNPPPQKLAPPTDADLPDVQRPATPTYQHVPAELPPPMGKPVLPPQPLYPSTQVDIPILKYDEVGPGCGWAFTGMVKPTYDPAAEAANQQREQQFRQKLDTDMAEYAAAAAAWQKQYAAWQPQAQAYRGYVATVADIDDKWKDQGRYWREVDEYNAAVKERNDFIIRQQQASQGYDSKVAQCAASTTTTTVPRVGSVPQPSTSTSTSTTQPSTPGCPPLYPPILRQQPPPVPATPRLPRQ